MDAAVWPGPKQWQFFVAVGLSATGYCIPQVSFIRATLLAGRCLNHIHNNQTINNPVTSSLSLLRVHIEGRNLLLVLQR